MKLLSFDYSHAGISPEMVKCHLDQLSPEIIKIRDELKSDVDSPYASLRLPYEQDQNLHATINTIKKMQPHVLVIIGIGGSNLGTVAVQEALLGKFYNNHETNIKIYYADTVDSDYVWDIFQLVEQALQEQQTVILNVVSKSGTTLETIANFELFLQLLRSYLGDACNKYVVATSDKGSALWDYAQEQAFHLLEIPAQVGGRYSVFSAVGLFPLGVLGLDIEQLRAGARAIIELTVRENILDNMPAISACVLYDMYSEDVRIHNTFLFSVDLASMGAWYRQLLGESIGKEFDRDGISHKVGITPTVSIGSTDLHSVGQLYLTGIKDTFTTFVTVEKNKSACQVPDIPAFNRLVKNIQGKQLSEIMDAIAQATQRAYQQRSLPYVTITLPEKSAYYIGQWLQFKMCEIIYLGYLLRINPFDQPNVELYKKFTKELLSHA